MCVHDPIETNYAWLHAPNWIGVCMLLVMHTNGPFWPRIVQTKQCLKCYKKYFFWMSQCECCLLSVLGCGMCLVHCNSVTVSKTKSIVTLALIWRKETNFCTRDWSFSFACCSCYRLQRSKLRSHGNATSRFRSVTWRSFAEDILCKVAGSLACIVWYRHWRNEIC